MGANASDSELKDLAVIPKDDRLRYFTVENAIDPILDLIRARVDGFQGDEKTPSGRKEIKSMAYRIGLAKGQIERVGKELAAEQKEIPKLIDATRRRVDQLLTSWQDEVRAPLDKWEEAEQARIQNHTDAIADITRLVETAAGQDSTGIRSLLKAAESVAVGPQCEEFADEYERAKSRAIEALTGALAARVQHESDQEELARLRRDAAEREVRENAERVAREAAEAEERRKHDEADRVRLAAEKATQDERDRAEQAAAALAAQAAAEREAAECREADLRRQAEDAERRAQETEARLRREAEEAKQREAEELAAREADRAHRTKINREAVSAMVAGGLAEETAKVILTLIVKRQVPHVSISY